MFYKFRKIAKGGVSRSALGLNYIYYNYFPS